MNIKIFETIKPWKFQNSDLNLYCQLIFKILSKDIFLNLNKNLLNVLIFCNVNCEISQNFIIFYL